MPTLWNRSASNRNKSLVLFSLMIVFVMVIGYFFGILLGGLEFGIVGLIIAFFFALIWAFVSYFYSSKFALAIARAKPADEKQFLKLHILVEGLSIASEQVKFTNRIARLRKVNGKVKFHCMNMKDLKFEENSFRVSFCSLR